MRMLVARYGRLVLFIFFAVDMASAVYYGSVVRPHDYIQATYWTAQALVMAILADGWRPDEVA